MSEQAPDLAQVLHGIQDATTAMRDLAAAIRAGRETSQPHGMTPDEAAAEVARLADPDEPGIPAEGGDGLDPAGTEDWETVVRRDHARITETIFRVIGIDQGTAEWLAAGVFRELAQMRRVSLNRPADQDGDPDPDEDPAGWAVLYDREGREPGDDGADYEIAPHNTIRETNGPDS